MKRPIAAFVLGLVLAMTGTAVAGLAIFLFLIAFAGVRGHGPTTPP